MNAPFLPELPIYRGVKPHKIIDRQCIIDEARSWLGTPYQHQTSTKGAGSDCLGLIRGVWRALYLDEPEIVPPYTPDWNERHFNDGYDQAGGPWNRLTDVDPLLDAARRHMPERCFDAPQPGDVVIFRIMRHGPAKHCGIMTPGHNSKNEAEPRFIHAYAGREVCESWLNRWWLSRIAGVFSFPGSGPWPSSS